MKYKICPKGPSYYSEICSNIRLKQIKNLQQQIGQKQTEMDQCRKLIKLYERKDKIADVQASKNTSKSDSRIAKLQQQISRYQKIEKDLIKQISIQQANVHKNANYLQQLTAKHEQSKKQAQKQRKLSPPKPHPQVEPPSNPNSVSQQSWSQLKRQFLLFKQTKHNEEQALNQQNDRLRSEIKQWEKKIKDKRKRIQSLAQIHQKNRDRQSRVYSTLNAPEEGKGYRYRDRNNSIQYNTKQ